MDMVRTAHRALFAVALGLTATAATTPVAAAGGPDGAVDTAVVSRAVGSGLRDGSLIGFAAEGPTNQAAGDAVVAACQNTGAQQCSRDEVTNDVFCIVSVGADNGSGIVSGGAGATLDAARAQAFDKAGQAGVTLDPSARTLASSCP